MITNQLLAEIDSLKDKLLETQKDLSFRRDLYALQNQLADQLRKYLIEARAEAKKWKDNHDNQVKINHCHVFDSWLIVSWLIFFFKN